jgi:ribonuclease R
VERKVVQGITIDSEQTRDIDDALWISFDNGCWHIYVSIADVAEAVPPGGKIDTRAREMVTTKYFRLGNSPMLPRHFAEDELSLWPDKERKTMTVDITVSGGPDVEIRNVEIYPSTLKSVGRVTYDKIPGLLKAKPQTTEYDIANIGSKMAMALLDRRRKAGAMVLYDLNNGWVSTEEGFLRQLEKKEETIGYILIQEMMILANSKVAEFAVKHNIPVLFRNHTAMAAIPDRAVLMQQIQDALTTPLADLDVVRQRTHMLLGRANYGGSLLGHYGLNLPAYLHFTSPIRRYADLITQRQIKAFLDGEPFPYTQKDIEEVALHINDQIELERERESMHFKTKAEEQAHRAIDARRLDGLDAAHFERVSKVEARSGGDPSDAFEEAYLRRLKENRLPLISLCVILTLEGATEGWGPLRQATIDQLAKRPEDAVSLLAMAQNVAGWNETKYKITAEGPDHARSFTCEASLDFKLVPNHEIVIGVGRGSTSKLAKYHAAIDLLARLGGNTVPAKVIQPAKVEGPEIKEHEVVRLSVAMPEKYLLAGSTGVVVHVYPDAYEVEFITDKGHEVIKVPCEQVTSLTAFSEKAPSGTGKDPVSALMEYAQKSKVAAPDFSYDKSGPDHVSTFTCTCRLGTIVKEATASNKQEAKKLAAKRVLEAVS